MIKLMTKKEKNADSKNEGVIHRNITENENETNWYTLKKLIEEYPDNTPQIDMEECVNDKDD